MAFFDKVQAELNHSNNNKIALKICQLLPASRWQLATLPVVLTTYVSHIDKALLCFTSLRDEATSGWLTCTPTRITTCLVGRFRADICSWRRLNHHLRQIRTPYMCTRRPCGLAHSYPHARIKDIE